MGKVDIHSAYRMISVNLHDWWLLGMGWEGTTHAHAIWMKTSTPVKLIL